MNSPLRRRPLARGRFAIFAVALAWLATGTHGLTAASDESSTRKLDSHLQHAIDRDGDDVTERVIIQVDADAAGSVEAVLKGRGEKPLRYHAGIAAFTVRAKHLVALAKHPGIKSISVDAPLEALGLRFADDAFRTPLFDATTFETTRPGMYLAGTVCGGYRTGRWFIENGRFHAQQIVKHIAGLAAEPIPFETIHWKTEE